MKRTLALLLACMMLFSCLSVAVADDKPTLTVWIPVYQFGDGPDDLTFWNEHLADFAAENNCEIIVEIKPWTDYYTAAYTALAGTDGPDVVYGPTYDFMANGLLLALDDYFTAEEIDNYLYWNTGLQMGGKQYCVPMMVGNARVMFYNMDILKAAGINELPATWDDFIDMCKTIKAALPDVKPFLQNWGASTGTAALMTCFWPMYEQAGGKILDENGYPNVNNEAGLKTLEYIKRFMDEGIFDESIVAEGDAVGLFEQGQLAAVVNGTGKYKSFGDYEWAFHISPLGPGGMATQVASEGMGVSAKTKYPELAVGIVKAMTSAKSMDDFHTQVYAMPKITKDSTFKDVEAFEDMYTNQADLLSVFPGFEGAGSFEETLRGNIQLMLMGDLTPQQVLDETMNYYNEQIRQ
ncbi:MAG: sugar ABC transporter substrate-binding protein [Clostridia bacterium]|nr:sugar ABC transporter substrate-binding protein [Clostridia bacterium]